MFKINLFNNMNCKSAKLKVFFRYTAAIFKPIARAMNYERSELGWLLPMAKKNSHERCLTKKILLRFLQMTLSTG